MDWVWESSFSVRFLTTVSILSAVPVKEPRIRLRTSVPIVFTTCSAMATASLPKASEGLPTSRPCTTERNEVPAESRSSACRRSTVAQAAIAVGSTRKPLPVPVLPPGLSTLATTSSARSAIGLASAWASCCTASSSSRAMISRPIAMIAAVLSPKVAEEAANCAWMLISWTMVWPLHISITRAAPLSAVATASQPSTTMPEYLEMVCQSAAS